MTAVVVLLLFACATPALEMRYNLDPNGTSGRVWPPLPEVPRYRYMGELVGEQNFVQLVRQQPGAGRRILNWLAGLNQRQRNPVQLLRPQSGMADPVTGRIFVTDLGQKAVAVFDLENTELVFWRNAGDNEQFHSPVGIARSGDNEIWVADAELGKIVRLDNNGLPLGGIGKGILTRPTGLAWDKLNQRMYVADTAKHDIKVLNADGSLHTVLGGPGGELGQFNGPTHLAFYANRLYVSDTLNARVQVITPAGEPVLQVGQQGLYLGNLVRPKGVTVDEDGNVYVVEGYFDYLLVFNAASDLLLPLGGTGSGVGEFYLPAGAWSDENGRIFIADMFNGRVVILQYLGA